MNRRPRHLVRTLPILLAIASPSSADAPNAGSVEQVQADYLQAIDRLMPALGAERYDDRRAAEKELQKFRCAVGGPGRSADREALSLAIMKRLGPDVPALARIPLLQMVGSIGDDKVVPGLAGMLGDKDARVREAVLNALRSNLSPGVAAVLRKELAAGGDAPWRAAVIAALGERRDVESAGDLATLAIDRDPVIAKAAIRALGETADGVSLEALAVLRRKTTGDLLSAAVNASVRAAGQLAKDGNKTRAMSLLRELDTDSAPEQTRIAVLQGLTKVQGPEALPRLLKAINSPNERIQVAAGRLAETIPGQEVTAQLVAAAEKAAVYPRETLLDTVARRGDVSAVPLLARYVESSDRGLCLATVWSLRSFPCRSTIELLAGFAARTTDKSAEKERTRARESLKQMAGGPKTDDLIISMITAAEPRVRAELIRAAAVRQIKDL
jgi:HEAT repeat protein